MGEIYSEKYNASNLPLTHMPPPCAGLEHRCSDVAEMLMVREEQYLCLLGQVSQYR